MLALVLIMSRYHYNARSDIYESSRWNLVLAMLLLAVHYILQMVFGFRAQGDDVGALVNIIFYAPVSYLIGYVNMTMTTGSHKFRSISVLFIISFILIITCVGIGWFMYHSLHMNQILYVMGSIYLVTIVVMHLLTYGKVREIQRQVENETSDDIHVYKMYMRTGYYLLCFVSILIPIVIFKTSLLLVAAPVFLFAMTFYVVCFVAVGFNVSPIAEVVDQLGSIEEEGVPVDSGQQTKTEKPGLTPERIEEIEAALSKWHQERGYSMLNTTSATMARRIGVPKKDLIQYLSEVKGETFRVWLSNIRIEEAKRLLLEKEGYNNEAIALECGFSSRSWMYEKFKASTGMTPSEWRDNMKKLNTEE